MSVLDLSNLKGKGFEQSFRMLLAVVYAGIPADFFLLARRIKRKVEN